MFSRYRPISTIRRIIILWFCFALVQEFLPLNEANPTQAPLESILNTTPKRTLSLFKHFRNVSALFLIYKMCTVMKLRDEFMERGDSSEKR